MSICPKNKSSKEEEIKEEQNWKMTVSISKYENVEFNDAS